MLGGKQTSSPWLKSLDLVLMVSFFVLQLPKYQHLLTDVRYRPMLHVGEHLSLDLIDFWHDVTQCYRLVWILLHMTIAMSLYSMVAISNHEWAAKLQRLFIAGILLNCWQFGSFPLYLALLINLGFSALLYVFDSVSPSPLLYRLALAFPTLIETVVSCWIDPRMVLLFILAAALPHAHNNDTKMKRE